MATVTAVILVGTAHPNHSGICPTHELLLSENSRPAWSLYEMRSEKPPTVWVPTVDDMLEDGLLMTGLLVVKDPALVKAAVAFRRDYAERVQMYDDIDEADRHRLYELCRGVGPATKLIISVLQGSTLAGQLAKLGKYSVGVEVCQSVYHREYSAWSNAVEEHGSLPK